MFSKIAKSLSVALGVMSLLGHLSAHANPQRFTADERDWSMRPDRWDVPSTLPQVESLLDKPLQLDAQAKSWQKRVLSAQKSSELMVLGASVLPSNLSKVTGQPILQELPSDPTIPADVLQSLNAVFAAIQRAQPLLNEAVDSLPVSTRQDVLKTWKGIATNKEDGGLDRGLAKKAEAFDSSSLLRAAQEVSQAVDAQLDLWRSLAPQLQDLKGKRWKFSEGDVVLAGSGQERFSAKDLENVRLWVHWGPRATYEGPAGVAGEKQIQVVVDLGDDLTFVAPGQPSVGSGILGIGLVYLPSLTGQKVISAGDFSLGAGLFGVGGLFLEGQAHLQAGLFGQGAGAWGAGILASWSGQASTYTLGYGGQGYGLTQGFGLLLQRGSGAVIRGGFAFPDPREPLGSTSFTQGVGYGPRAFAGGGVGWIAVQGDNNRLESSYFAQGAAYWHSLGACFISGSNNKLQARRYSQGSGVHSALGYLSITGDRNQSINWGVGPAYGWDFGVGQLDVRGNENHLQADWGAGHGEIGGLSFSRIEGDRNRILLPEFGSGAMIRNGPSYGWASVNGSENQLRAPQLESSLFLPSFERMLSPWSFFSARGGLHLRPDLAMVTPIWPEGERSKARAQEKVDLQSLLRKADQMPAPERIATWIRIASSFSLDRETPIEARRRLLSIPSSELPLVVSALSSDSVDAYLQIRFVLSAFASQLPDVLGPELARAQGTQKVLLASFLAMGPAEKAIPVLEPLLQDSDWRVRRVAASAMASLFNQERGRSPGRRYLIDALASTPEVSLSTTTWDRILRLVTVEKLWHEMVPLMTLQSGLRPEDRERVATMVQDPIAPLTKEHWIQLRTLVNENLEAHRSAWKKESSALSSAEPRALAGLRRVLGDADAEVVAAGLVGLGLMNSVADLQKMANAFGHSRLGIREGASTAVAKLNERAFSILRDAITSEKRLVRESALRSVAQSPVDKVQRLVFLGLSAQDRRTRLVALSILRSLLEPTRSLKKEIYLRLGQMAKKDVDASVRTNAILLRDSFKP